MLTPEQIIDVLNFRHATKDFDPDRDIPAADFDLILEAARLSPSSYGLEPWMFVVVHDPKIRQKLADVSPGGHNQIPHASQLIVILARRGSQLTPESEYIHSVFSDVQQLDPATISKKLVRFDEWQQRDFDLTDDRKRLDWAKRQTYIALADMMLVAALRGIDSCPIEGFNLEEVDKIMSADCGIDLEKFGTSVMVTFGYRINPPQPKHRGKQSFLDIK